jgi:hypothetical protein
MKITGASLLATCAMAAALFASSAAEATTVVSAGYDGGADNSYFTVTTDVALTNLTFSGIGTSGSALSNALTGIWNLGAVGVGSTTFYFSQFATVFQYDFDDYYSGSAKYTATATTGSGILSGMFSPESNASGSFLGFLGNDASGNEWDASVDGRVAVLTSAVPLPAALPLFAAALGAAGMVRRRRNMLNGATTA